MTTTTTTTKIDFNNATNITVQKHDANYITFAATTADGREFSGNANYSGTAWWIEIRKVDGESVWLSGGRFKRYLNTKRIITRRLLDFFAAGHFSPKDLPYEVSREIIANTLPAGATRHG